MNNDNRFFGWVVALSAAAGLGLLWFVAKSSSTVEQFGQGRASGFEDASATGWAGDGDSQPAASQGHPEVLVLRDLRAEAKGRPRRVFRELATERDPELEADPQFQKLLEMDSARKMALIDKNPAELARLRKEVTEPGSKITRSVLEEALIDPNTEVRLAALYEISLTMDEVPIDLLAAVVAGDPKAEVRLEALEIVAESESNEAVAVVRTALNDPDERVRAEAEDLLDEWAEEMF